MKGRQMKHTTERKVRRTIIVRFSETLRICSPASNRYLNTEARRFLAGLPPAFPRKSDITPENLPTMSDPMPNLENDDVNPALSPTGPVTAPRFFAVFM